MKRQYLAFKELVECGLVEKHNDICYTSIETPCLKNRKGRGYVYVLCGYFPDYDKPVKKIGISDRPMFRYRTITSTCPYSDELELLLLTADVLYREAEKEQDLALLKGLMSTYEVLEGKAKEETRIIIKGLQAALNFA